MLKGSSGKGLLPHENLPAVLLHQRINRPVDFLLKENRIIAFIPPFQFRLDRITEVRGSQKPRWQGLMGWS
jgi:hypothetical protein